jgi:signal transduction histidine kinase
LSKKGHSLRTESFLLLLLSVAVGIGSFFGIRYIGNLLTDTFLKTSGYMEREEQKSANSLQNFVTEYRIAATDADTIDLWASSESDVYISILRNGTLLYDSEYTIPAAEDRPVYLSGTSHLYTVTFADGKASVYIIGFYGYRYASLVSISSIALAGFLAILFYLAFLQRKINYIKQLEKEIRNLETGGLSHPFTVKGRDELSSLAGGLNEMRTSLATNFEMVTRLSEANSALVTELSHDLRTPLTALLLYLELLQKRKYRDRETEEKYLQKAEEKAQEVKTMSDDLFERFLVTGSRKAEAEAPQSIRYIFEDPLSDMTVFLTSQGYTVKSDGMFPDGKLSVVADYICRILNNIESNIVKYADRKKEVCISMEIKEAEFIIRICNRIDPAADKSESTNIGLPNIRQMMQNMNGNCEVTEEDGSFGIALHFPLIRSDSSSSKLHPVSTLPQKP